MPGDVRWNSVKRLFRNVYHPLEHTAADLWRQQRIVYKIFTKVSNFDSKCSAD